MCPADEVTETAGAGGKASDGGPSASSESAKYPIITREELAKHNTAEDQIVTEQKL